MLSNEQKSTELYRLSLKCMELKQRGCVGNCSQCPLNAFLYTEDPREAGLIKMSAAIDADKMKEFNDQKRLKGIVLLLLLVAFIIFMIVKCSPSVPPPKDTIPYTTYEELVAYNASVYKRMPENMRDVNHDGVINCIDYSVVFYELWGTYGCRIIRNINHATGMNHLFVSIYLPEKNIWVYIEPQDRWLVLELVWGSRYDAQYNTDETAHWARYAR